MSAPWYATREEVGRELDFKEPTRSSPRIDRAIDSASRKVEALCHRRFYPEAAARSFDWPNQQYARPERLWLESNELISVSSLVSGGLTIGPGEFFLRRSDDVDEPPYNLLELNLGTNAAFGGGSTHQRDITITGTFGYRDDQSPAGQVVTAVSAVGTSVTVTNSAAVGVGALLRIGTERLIVTDRSMTDTGQDLATPIDAQQKTAVVPVADGSVFPVGETILLDAERMLILDIAGASLIVQRAVDGSVLAPHTGSDIYAPRALTVRRGVLGSTAAPIPAGADISVWQPPGPVRSLCIAEALTELLQGRSGYARVVGSGENQRESSGRGLRELREQVYASHGRKGRVRAV